MKPGTMHKEASRGRCPVCGTFVALGRGDLTREHWRGSIGRRTRLSVPCKGSGKLASEVTLTMPRLS